SALKDQLPRIEQEAGAEDWVFIEIGGNDMLGDTSTASFAEKLDPLLARARGDPDRPRTVVMMELPIFIGRWGYAVQQRDLAARHGVVLVPKRLLADVLLTTANTIDGIHLSKVGHQRMATLLAPWLGAE